MEERKVRIRAAKEEDAKGLLEIYAPYVTGTAITFEYDVPSEEEFTSRIRHTLEKYPYLVAEADGELLGYAYAGPFHARAAYSWGAETSIYVKKDSKRLGIGRKLYEALEKILSAQNILNLNACIAYPVQEDEYLTKDSVAFHEHLGYRLVGEFHQCGYKFHCWYDMVWMEKHIGSHVECPPEVKPFGEVKDLIQKLYGIQ